MKFKLYMMLVLLGLGITSASSAWAATCSDPAFEMDVNTGDASGAIVCIASGDGNLTLTNGTVTGTELNNVPGETTFTATGVTDISSYITVNQTTGQITILDALWDFVDTIYIGLKQGDGNSGGDLSLGGWGLFEITDEVSLADYLVFPPKNGGFELSHWIAYAITDSEIPGVPVPAAVWLFGSGLLGLFGASRRKKAAIPA